MTTPFSADWNRPLSRRNVLRGAGAVLALPFLPSWTHAVARAAGEKPVPVKPPLRMGIFTVTGGTVLESWKMPQAGALKKLPSILRPLEPLKDDLLILTGLSQDGQSENVNAHEHCAYMHLTGAAKVGKQQGKPFAGVSVDQAAAKVHGEFTYLPSMEIGMATGETRYSFRSADQLPPYMNDPRSVYERMFKGRPPVVPNWQRREAGKAAQQVRDSQNKGESYDRSVVDAVLEEGKAVRKKIDSSDRQKLDQYLETVRGLETRIDRMEKILRMEAEDAKLPGPSKLIEPKNFPKGQPFYVFERLINRDPEKHGEYIRLMADLMILALQTDTTRVVTFAVGQDDGLFPGVVTVGYETHCHTLEHQGNAGRVEDADPIAREALRQIHAWYTSLFAEMAIKMKLIDEGGGSTLLDNTLFLYTSYMADGGHGTRDYPVALVGKAGGTLKPGRQIDFRANTPMANLYVEMLDRMGVPSEGFGNSKTSKFAAHGGKLPGLGG